MGAVFGVISLAEKGAVLLPHVQRMGRKLEAHGPDSESVVVKAIEGELIGCSTGDTAPAILARRPDLRPLGPLLNVPVCWAVGHRLNALGEDPNRYHQPACDSRSEVWVSLDGEIYNQEEVCDRLSGRVCPHENVAVFIAEAYKNGGERIFEWLNGHFSLVLHDLKVGKTMLVRDRSGSRTLFYGKTGDHLVFGSNIRSLLASGLITPEVDWNGLWNNLSFPAPPQPLTTFRGICAVERGCYVSLDRDGRLSNHRYWSIPIDAMMSPDQISEVEAAEMLDEVFQRSVQRRCLGNAEVGSLISGGVDSPYICAAASRHISLLKVFTFGLQGDRFAHMNEFERAGLTASKYGMDHRIRGFKLEEMVPFLNDIIDLHEQPGGGFGTNYFLAMMAKEAGVKVLLNGLAADEQHGGFHYFKFIPLWHLIKTVPWSTFLIPRGRSKKWEDLKNLSLARTIDEYYTHAFSDLKEFEKNRLLPGMDFNSYETIRNCYARDDMRFQNDVQGLLYYMFANVPNHHLYRFDQFSRHFGIEARYPFLDNEFIDVSFRIPSSYKVRNGQRKIALKNAAKKWIAHDSVASKKQGLVMPMGYIVNHVLRDFCYEKLQSLKQREPFDALYIDHLYRHYREIIPGKIWKLVMTECWFERFIDRSDQ